MNEIAVEIKNLDFKYSAISSAPSVLKIDELKIATGQKVFLKGASGSGKTTLLSLLTGVLNSQVGQLTVLGQDLSTLSSHKRDYLRGEKMGYIFQMFNLIPYLTVQQNIELPCKLFKNRLLSIGQSHLADEVQRLSSALGIEKLLKNNVSNLSVGQQQRVAAARALIGRPQLIIADEPTSALDYDHRAKFIELLLKECNIAKTTVLFVSHDPTLAQYFETQLDMKQLNQA